MDFKKSYLWQLSEKLIGFDTVSFKTNSEAASLIANELDDLGFKTYIDQYDDLGVSKEQVIAWIGPEVSGGLILSGHIDTVPFENQKGWTKDALKLQLFENKIYGRGTCDMKIFIAHCLAAFQDIDYSKLQKPLVCIFTSDEEVGCLGAHRLTTHLDRILGAMPMPKRAVIGEPTELGIINTHKGIVQFDVITKGIAGHSSRPDLGRNAIEMARKVIALAEKMNDEFSSVKDEKLQKLFADYPYNHLHLAMISGGEAANIIPNTCELKFTYRYFPEVDPLVIFNEFQNRVARELHFDQEMIEIKFKRVTKGLPLSSDIELEKVLIDLTHNQPSSVAYATDGGEFSTLGIQSYICGAGSIKQAHMPDEYIEVEQFLKGENFIKKLITNILIN